jgi:putative ABC transport system permease protein
MIVGAFDAGGGAIESEVWADLPMMQSAFRLGSGVQSVRVKPSTLQGATSFKQRLAESSILGLTVQREADYYQSSVRSFFRTVRYFAYPLLIVMIVGAVFAALNTMYGAVAARSREIGTARALGFGAVPVAFAVVAESALLSVVGSLIGIALIYFSLNGLQANTNFLGQAQYAFSFVVSPDLMGQGLLCALAIGVLGGLFPAIRAGHMPIVRALAES